MWTNLLVSLTMSTRDTVTRCQDPRSQHHVLKTMTLLAGIVCWWLTAIIPVEFLPDIDSYADYSPYQEIAHIQWMDTGSPKAGPSYFMHNTSNKPSQLQKAPRGLNEASVTIASWFKISLYPSCPFIALEVLFLRAFPSKQPALKCLSESLSWGNWPKNYQSLKRD